MHLHKFADIAIFHEIGIGGTFPETVKYRDFLKKLHPSQLLSSMVSVPIYEVEYSYYTKRGNYRVARKYGFLPEHENLDFQIEMLLNDWVEEQNKRKPYRKISNVEILEIRSIAYAKVKIGY